MADVSTPLIQVIPQRHDSDCAVACVAMISGENYEQALLAFRHNVIKRGASNTEIISAARRLGCRLVWSRSVDLDNDTGLVALESRKWHDQHIVVIKDGLIVDTDGTIWDADAYLVNYRARVLSILKRRS